LGSACPSIALQAAKVVEKDCSAIDLNCGCPKKFSISGNMGAALLSTPDTLCEILETLVNGLSIPVTVKIRVFEDVEKTVHLIKRISGTGVVAIAVHLRTREMSSQKPALWTYISTLQKATHLPLIVNGDVFSIEDVQTIQSTACTFLKVVFMCSCYFFHVGTRCTDGSVHLLLPRLSSPRTPASD
jgi:tRNA-dihydrouridine synthase 2